MKKTVLICDDNIAVHESLSAYLHEARIDTVSVYNGEDALKALKSREIHFVILDLMLPGISGTDVLKELRRFSEVPVLVLSAKGSEFDKILGLELGADDYVQKPFSPREIATRVQVILKRIDKKADDRRIVFSNLMINLDAYTVTVGGRNLALTPKELQVLALLASKPGVVFSRERILDEVWGYDTYNDIRTVDTQVKLIRRKLPGDAAFAIRSVYGVGYKLEEE